MARKLKSDKALFLATLLLMCASLVMVYSASAVLALQRYQQPYYFLIKQGLWAALGLAVLALAMRFDYRHYRRPQVIWTLIGVVTLALIAVLFSAPINGSRRWFGLGGFGIQPSELAKLAIIIFSAAILERRMARIDEVAYSLTPIVAAVGVMVALILLEPDFGSAMALAAIAAVMVFSAGLGWRYIVGVALAVTPVIGVLLVAVPYRWKRVLAFLNPWDDPLGSGFHVIQSLIAIGTGGVSGKGLMAGVQKLFYLPEPHTDFIFAVIGEELGLIGATAVLLCFCVITWRGLKVAEAAQDRFGSFLALGVTSMIGVQAMANMSVVLGLLPTKGFPLPFVSAGGSSLLISMAGMGMLLNVSQHTSEGQ
jgi:cell division protein FtsW